MKDGDDSVLMEQSKFLGKVSVYDANCAALVEGLTAAAEAGVKILHVYCNSHTLVNQVSGEWKSNIPKRTRRLRQILEKREQFELFSIERAENHQNVYTASLALEAIRKKRVEVFFKRSKVDVPASQNDDYSSGSLKNVEQCPICVEKVSTTGVFRVKGCLHWFCVSCLTQHVEIRVKSNQVPVKCPQDCSNFINIDQYQNILSPELFEDYAKLVLHNPQT
ncbi:hypothetical protein R1flu_026006 [Riccia fluitans]|uniref:RBR-type E3 ubiquitin transferase n=1 Tax=Riccia fluitans TaxID=41844 RepID=A0ABD1XER0_9MARC